MKYLVDLEQKRIEVELGVHGARVGGDVVSATLADVEGTPMQMITLGDRVHRVVAQRGATRGQYVLWVDGWRISVEALDERARAIRDLSAEAAASGPRPLVAPMPGLIVKVLVVQGAAVSAGDPLVVMEAMKMENELRATAAGVVALVRASPGQAVEKGAVLIEIAPEPPPG